MHLNGRELTVRQLGGCLSIYPNYPRRQGLETPPPWILLYILNSGLIASEANMKMVSL